MAVAAAMAEEEAAEAAGMTAKRGLSSFSPCLLLPTHHGPVHHGPVHHGPVHHGPVHHGPVHHG